MKIHRPDSSSLQNPRFSHVVDLQKTPNEMYQDLLRMCSLILSYCLTTFSLFSLWCFELYSRFDLFLKKYATLLAVFFANSWDNFNIASIAVPLFAQCQNFSSWRQTLEFSQKKKFRVSARTEYILARVQRPEILLEIQIVPNRLRKIVLK